MIAPSLKISHQFVSIVGNLTTRVHRSEIAYKADRRERAHRIGRLHAKVHATHLHSPSAQCLGSIVTRVGTVSRNPSCMRT